MLLGTLYVTTLLGLNSFSYRIKVRTITSFNLIRSVPRRRRRFNSNAFKNAIVTTSSAYLRGLRANFMASRLSNTALTLNSISSSGTAFTNFFRLTSRPFFLKNVTKARDLRSGNFRTKGVGRKISGTFLSTKGRNRRCSVNIRGMIQLRKTQQIKTSSRILIVTSVSTYLYR